MGMLLASRNADEPRLAMDGAGLALRRSVLFASENTEELSLFMGEAGLALRMSVLLASARKDDNVYTLI